VTRAAIAAVAAAALLAAAAGAVYLWSGATLAGDASALARIDLQPFAGSVERVRATGPGGRPIPLDVAGGRLTPTTRVTPGEEVSVAVAVRRPGWSSWLLGKERRESLTVHAPVAHVRSRWLTARPGAPPRVRFDTAISSVSFGHGRVSVGGASVAVPATSGAGSIDMAVAARSWERLGAPVRVTWFPPASEPVVLASPAPGAQIDPSASLRLTFSQPISEVLGSTQPTLSPGVPGRWLQTDSHTLEFHAAGFGAHFASNLHVRFPHTVAVSSANGSSVRASRGIDWQVAPASFLRLQQLLAEQGYLPLAWSPDADVVARSARAQLAAAVDPPAGEFTWRYSHTPIELQQLWKLGEPNTIVRGAVMMFQDEHDLTVDGIAGADVWHALLADAVAGKQRRDGYSYVFVHRNVPQLLTLWHNGEVVLTSPGNTGVPAAPTALGTFPVFEHIPVGRMSGTNPDGSHYDDPGIRWISYFHEGEALHAFNRNSFGTPQSLGCVELPLASAAKVWPYTPIGTLVTIED
jgi:hypothetical protein